MLNAHGKLKINLKLRYKVDSMNSFFQQTQSHAWVICVFLGLTCLWLTLLYFRLKQRYYELAQLNPYTQLENKRLTLAKLKLIFYAAKRYQHALTIGILHIPLLKKLRDDNNHALANQCLTKIAQILQQELRNADHLGHYQQDQFLLVLTNTNSHNARAVFSRILQKIESLSPDKQVLRCYLGYTNCHKQTKDMTVFTKEAEHALQKTYAIDDKNIQGYQA
jgi:diguanylate cyclase (GGDEF)-like protein